MKTTSIAENPIIQHSPTPVSGPAPQSPVPIHGADLGGIGKVDVLTDAEMVELRSCEANVRKGWEAAVEAGLALARIRDGQLYRTEFTSFEAYCRIKWNFQHSKVYAWISAAQVFTLISAMPDGPRPDHESQLRPLFGLTPTQVQLAWQCAVVNSGGRKITARVVKNTLNELQLAVKAVPATRRINKREQRKVVSDLVNELVMLIMQQAAHEILREKAEGLVRELHLLFAPSVAKSVKSTSTMGSGC